jgi:hypothetical protein
MTGQVIHVVVFWGQRGFKTFSYKAEATGILVTGRFKLRIQAPRVYALREVIGKKFRRAEPLLYTIDCQVTRSKICASF